MTLPCYLQEVGGEFGFGARSAVLVLPGGGYVMCSDLEADPVALAYARAGYQAFVLRYTVGPDCVWPEPLADYEQAIPTVQRQRPPTMPFIRKLKRAWILTACSACPITLRLGRSEL